MHHATLRGYLLIELIVAMSVFTIGFLAVLGLTANAVSATRVITDSFTANYLAMEGIEVVKSIVDENALDSGPWNQGIQERCYLVNYNSTRGGSTDWDVMTCPSSGSSLIDAGTAPLKFTPSTGLYSRQGGPGNNFSPFYRMVHVIPEGGSPRYIKLESVVAWIGRGGTRNEIMLEDYLFDQK